MQKESSKINTFEPVSAARTCENPLDTSSGKDAIRAGSCCALVGCVPKFWGVIG